MSLEETHGKADTHTHRRHAPVSALAGNSRKTTARRDITGRQEASPEIPGEGACRHCVNTTQLRPDHCPPETNARCLHSEDESRKKATPA